MDKYEKKVRVNQIVSCIRKGEYKEAQDVADTIDWRQEKSIRTLRMVSEVYKINRRYEDALTVLSLAYEKDPEDPIKKKIVYDLCELAIKMNQFGYAVRFMKEFSKLAPRDPGRYILQYRLLKATDADYNERIELLEEFKANHYGDMDAKWAYELADLYHQTGQGEKCVACCDDIVVWHVTGPVVIKALKLKREHKELTYEEEQKIRSAEEGEDREEVIYQKRHRTDTAPVYMDTTPVVGDGYSTTDAEDRFNPRPEDIPRPAERIQSRPMQQMPVTPVGEAGELNIEVKQVDPSSEPTIRMASKKKEPSILSRETTVIPDVNKAMSEPAEPEGHVRAESIPETAEMPAEMQQTEQPEEPATPETVTVSMPVGVTPGQEVSVNVDKFSTMNLQAELRENMERLQEETGEPLREKEEKLPERTAEPDKELTELKAPEPEVQKPVGPAPQMQPEERAAASGAMSDEEVASKISKVPDQFKNIISQEYDGQMQLNVPAETAVDDKQITGQMDIESVLAEWDKLQEEAKERRIKAAKKKSLEQTNDIVKDLVSVLPGYSLPKIEEPAENVAPVREEEKTSPDLSKFVDETDTSREEQPEPEKATVIKPPEMPPRSETGSLFTAPLVIPDEGDEEELSAEAAGITPEGDEEETAIPEKEKRPHRKEDRKPENAEEKPQPKKPYFVTDQTVQLPSVFDTFLHIKGLGPQLKDAEDKFSMESSHGNALIIGSEQAARIELIQAIARDMSEKYPNASIRTATIDADVFNGKNVAKSLKALSGNILVIERAGHLSDDAMNSLLEVLSSNEEKLFVMLEDSKGGAKNLAEYSGFTDVFDILVDIPTLSNDYLVSHAKEYADDKGYILDDMAVLALYQRIDERQTADHVVSSDEVERIIDAAIRKSNKKNMKYLGDVLFGKRYNDDDMVILREKDFTK